MSKVYVELGAYRGDTVAKAMKQHSDLNIIAAFEPIPQFYSQLCKRFEKDERVTVFPFAAGTEDSADVELFLDSQKTFIGSGSTLFSEKASGIIDKGKFVIVPRVDFSRFVKEHFQKDDHIIIRINIEGGEYDLLEHLIATGAIHYFDEMECHWHYKKSFQNSKRITEERQDALLEKLTAIFGDSLMNRGL